MNDDRKIFAGFDHVDARVRDLAAARRFYDAVMPHLGLTEIVENDGSVEYYEPLTPDRARRFFGIHHDPHYHANATRICFAADSPAEVDRLGTIVRNAGAAQVEGPEIPYSYEKYYAVFFEDPSGNKLEIAYRRSHDDGVAKRGFNSEFIDATEAFGTGTK